MTAQSELFEDKMSALEFGQGLLVTGDLDPIYIMLHKSSIEGDKLLRWLLAYWMFYSAGTASELCVYEGQKFYQRTMYLADEGRGARGAERRHFRGKACFDSIGWFIRHYPKPEDAVLALQRIATFSQLREFISAWPLFGPWITFKICDMLERVLNWPVDFSDCNLLGIYNEPREGAEILAKQLGSKDAWTAVHRLIIELQAEFAPPNYNRPPGLQEVETILCKWKSYLKGHYYIGKDCKEIRQGLILQGGDVSLSLLAHVPEIVTR